MINKLIKKHRAGKYRKAAEATPEATRKELHELSFEYLQAIYGLMRTSQKLEGEDKHTAEALGMHPEFHKMFEGDYQDYEDEEFISVSLDGMSPGLHLGIHSSVLKQLEEQNPPEIVECYESLKRSGITRHNIHHILGMAWSGIFVELEHGYSVEQANDRYAERLRKLMEAKVRTIEMAMAFLKETFDECIR